ncbi:MAG: type VII secretion-associated protein [Mycolicibacterium insubricum]|nr:type VII secretion-associated protein [Mycobacterium sp.]
MTVIAEIGPRLVRRLDGGPDGGHTDPNSVAAALAGGDDALTLLGSEAVPVAAAWRAALAPLLTAGEDALLIHPSRWPPMRVRAVTAVAAALCGAPVRPVARRELHTDDTGLFVEIDIDAVLLGDRRHRRLCHRLGDPAAVADTVAADLAEIGPGAVALDSPPGVPGAAELAALITTRLREAGHRVVTPTAAALAAAARATVPAAGPVHPRRCRALAAGIAVTAGLAGAAVLVAHHRPVRTLDEPGTSTLIEGRLAVTVPADWTVRRVTGGPGSARVEVRSPRDPQVALHLTQARSGVDPATTAELLRRAVTAAPPGVFVDFDPESDRYGRSGIGYRELRPEHEITWTVLADDELRIGIGCQSPPGNAAAIAAACETAVRTAHGVR